MIVRLCPALVLLFLLSCAPSKPVPTAAPASVTQKAKPAARPYTAEPTSTGHNNQVQVITTGTPSGSGGGTRVVFKGSNNLLEVIQHNPVFFDSPARDVLIIEGDGNVIRLYNASLVDMKPELAKTLVLVGNKQKYVVSLSGEVPLKRQPVSIDTVFMETRPLQAATYTQDLQHNTEGLEYVKKYLAKIALGEAQAYYDLAQVYHLGLHDVPVAMDKAIALYEYGATRQDIESIRRLGDLYANGTFDTPPNLQKARYYYSLGAQLKDEYCQKYLAELPVR
ncbi:hypothetical protein [Nibribacter koreensis]